MPLQGLLPHRGTSHGRETAQKHVWALNTALLFVCCHDNPWDGSTPTSQGREEAAGGGLL